MFKEIKILKNENKNLNEEIININKALNLITNENKILKEKNIHLEEKIKEIEVKLCNKNDIEKKRRRNY